MYRPARVRLQDCDPDWPVRYEQEARLLTAALRGRLLAIEHVGSTAIDGMPAKPIIDILVTVPVGYPGFGEVVDRLDRLGYVYTPEAEADDPGRRVFRKGPADMTLPRTHHLHVTEADSHYGRRLVAFRDHLRCHPADAAAYLALKRELAERWADRSRDYTAGKRAFVAAIELRAGVRPPAS